jgi:RNA polymerase sigma factor (sigma-70 family)
MAADRKHCDNLERLSVTRLLVEWQRSRCPLHFAQMIEAIRPLMEKTARCTLHRRGCRDPHAMDEVESLVMEHLWRLTESAKPGARVTAFTPPTSADGRDHGLAYVTWLTTRRALDVLRRRRRCSERESLFSEIADAECRCTANITAADGNATDDEQAVMVRNALRTLDQRSQQVMAMLLSGLAQIEVAKQLGLCEGTISRVRSRAVEQLGGILGNGVRTPPARPFGQAARLVAERGAVRPRGHRPR